MEKTYIETSGSGLIYESEKELYNFLLRNKDTLEFPGLKISQEIPSHFPYVVTYRNGNNGIICSDNSIDISYPIDELTEASIVFMGYILMEKQRAEKSMVTIHSACIEKDNNGILLLGRAGSGKTTLSIDLCQKHGFSLIGNDRNVIGYNNQDKILAFDGTKFLFLRYESIKRNLPHLLHLFPEKDMDSWLRKVKIMPEEIGISCSQNIPIRKSYIVHIDNNMRDLCIRNGDTPENRLYLNELFSMYIRGIYTTFCDNQFHAQGYIPSYDSKELYLKRIKLINDIFEKTNLEYISGCVDDVSEYVNEKQKKLVYTK